MDTGRAGLQQYNVQNTHISAAVAMAVALLSRFHGASTKVRGPRTSTQQSISKLVLIVVVRACSTRPCKLCACLTGNCWSSTITPSKSWTANNKLAARVAPSEGRCNHAVYSPFSPLKPLVQGSYGAYITLTAYQVRYDVPRRKLYRVDHTLRTACVYEYHLWFVCVFSLACSSAPE